MVYFVWTRVRFPPAPLLPYDNSLIEEFLRAFLWIRYQNFSTFRKTPLRVNTTKDKMNYLVETSSNVIFC